MAKGERNKARAEASTAEPVDETPDAPEMSAATEKGQSADASAEAAPVGEPEQTPPEGRPSEDETAGPASDDASDESPESEPLTPEQELASLKEQVAEAADRHARAVADLDNYRKRARREQQDALRYANANLMEDVLPVIDNFERALASETEGAGETQLREGVDIILRQLTEVLERHGLKPIAALGERFDPSKHEGLGQMPSDEYEPGCIAVEAVRGYALHDRVVRASQVFVAAAPDEIAEGAADETDGAPPEPDTATDPDETDPPDASESDAS